MAKTKRHKWEYSKDIRYNDVWEFIYKCKECDSIRWSILKHKNKRSYAKYLHNNIGVWVKNAGICLQGGKNV